MVCPFLVWWLKSELSQMIIIIDSVNDFVMSWFSEERPPSVNLFFFSLYLFLSFSPSLSILLPFRWKRSIERDVEFEKEEEKEWGESDPFFSFFDDVSDGWLLFSLSLFSFMTKNRRPRIGGGLSLSPSNISWSFSLKLVKWMMTPNDNNKEPRDNEKLDSKGVSKTHQRRISSSRKGEISFCSLILQRKSFCPPSDQGFTSPSSSSEISRMSSWMVTMMGTNTTQNI